MVDPLRDSPLTYNETLQAFVDFLEVSISTILCLRNVYDPDVFALRKKYDTQVYQCRHPGLNEYVRTVLKHIRTELDKSTIEEVTLVLASQITQAGLEAYHFRFDYLLDDGTRTAPLGGDDEDASGGVPARDRDVSISGNLTHAEVDVTLRAFIVKLMMIDAALAPLTDVEDLTFRIEIRLREGRELVNRDENYAPSGPWVPAQTSNLAGAPNVSHSNAADDGPTSLRARPRRGLSSSSEGPGGSKQRRRTVPIRETDSGVVDMRLIVEENLDAKAQLAATPAFTQAAAPLANNTVADAQSKGKGKQRDLDEPAPLPPASARPARKRRGATGGVEEVEMESASEDERSEGSVGDWEGFGAR